MNHDEVAKALLGMAEALRTQDPPKLKMAIKCARSTLKLETSEELTALCNFQLGKLLFFYTDNFELAKTHLQIAHAKMTPMGAFYTKEKLYAISMIADLYIHYQAWPLSPIKAALRHEIGTTHGYPVLTYKLMFQLIELMKIDKDVKGAFEVCEIAINQCQNDPKMELYFRITKTLVTYQLMHDEPENAEVARIGSMIKALEGIPSERSHVECIKDFFVCTKLSYMFYEGKSRTSRQLLRQIQRAQWEQGPTHGIRWLGETSMTVFACVLNIVSALVQSNSDRVEKYYYLLMKHADEILFKSARSPQEMGVVRCINMIKMTTLEMMACCNVMACRPQKALVNVQNMLEVSHRSSGPLLYRYFAPHMQYLLGLQSCYLRENDAAEKHFLSAIKMFQKDGTNAENTIALLNLNLAMTYLNQLKMAEYYDVAENLTAPKIAGCSQMLKNNVKLLSAFFSYLTNKPNECRALVHEVLHESKAEDFFRLHGCALLLMSLIVTVDEQGVKPTCDWSKKSHDHVMTVWSYNLYERIMMNNKCDLNSEVMRVIQAEQLESKNALSVDTLVPQISNMQISKLLQWFEGDPFKLLPRDETVL
uniref:Cohesin loading complex subunit SCC4 homolog n=1 Tax=Caenorhabditis japonica TaxID=281687 RepID=A0A8R1DW06_CAEJA